MSLFNRMVNVTEAKVNKFLNRIEDPNEMLDLSYEKMLSQLQEIKAHIADVATEKKRLSLKIDTCKSKANQHDQEARAAVKLGKDDLAKHALSLKQTALSAIEPLQRAFEQISIQLDKLVKSQDNYKQRIEQFRQEKEISKATYQAAKAQVDIKESLSGVGDKVNNVGQLLERAQDKADTMTARAAAMDELTDSEDDVQTQLSKATQECAVDDELAKLKGEVNLES